MGNTQMVPNIFTYATKELSQDALICWLVACAKDETDERLRECGRKFVQALMRSGDGAVIDVSNDSPTRVRHVGSYDVGGVLDGPEPQYQKIDVYFQAEVDGKRVSFVIEDKTDTEMHGDQLERYRSIVQGDKYEEDLIKPVYFKTGYVFHDEREKANSNGFSVFNGEDMLAFLNEGQCADAHEILRQFAEHLGGQVKERHRALEEWQLKHGFVQWEFMVALRKVLRTEKEMWPGKGVNTGGSAWTQYPHWDDRGSLFWRLDSWMPLRLMLNTRKVGTRDIVLRRWETWSRAFEDVRKESGLDMGKFRRVRSRKGGLVKEGTIGAVDIASCLRVEGLDKCVARVERLYRAFKASVGAELS